MEIEDDDFVIVVVADRNVDECYRQLANGEFHNKEINIEEDLDIEEIINSVMFHGETININSDDTNSLKKEHVNEHEIKDKLSNYCEENRTRIKEESGIEEMKDYCGSNGDYIGVDEHDKLSDYCETNEDNYLSLKNLSKDKEIKRKYKKLKSGKRKTSQKKVKKDNSGAAKDSSFNIDRWYLNNEEILCNIKQEHISDDEQKAQNDLHDFHKKNKKNKLRSKNSRKNEEEHRYKMLKPWQTRSLVKQLMIENPEVANDSKCLVNLIVEEMRRLRPPPPPKDFLLNSDDKMLVCSICGAQSERISAAQRHYQEKHGPRYLYCFACGVNFRSNTNLLKHEKRCVALDAVLVLKARAIYVGSKGRSRPFISSNKYRMFRSGEKPRRVFNCELCPATFQSKIALNNHVNSHMGLKPHLCPHCPMAYTSASACYRHIMKHDGQRYICDHCNRSFKSKETLIVHLYTHLPEKRFGCDMCERRYAQKRALVQHYQTKHEGRAPPHACSLCDKRYFRLSLLNDHMKKFHGLKVISRKMFFKNLPNLTTTELEKAKIVKKSEEQPPS